MNKLMKLPTYEGNHYILENGEALNKEYPDSFYIPSKIERENLKHGDLVKLIFNMEEIIDQDDVSIERMWVIITCKENEFYSGKLDNDPAGDVFVKCGVEVFFKAENVIEIFTE